MKQYLKYTFLLVWRQKKKFLLLVLLVVIDTAARIFQPFIYKILVDTLTTGLISKTFVQAQITLLIQLIIGWFFLSLINNIVHAENHFLVWNMGSVNSHRIHVDGYRRLLRLDYARHTKQHSSQLAKIVDDADTSMWEMTNWWLGRFFPSTLGFIGMLAIAFSVSWQMTLVSLIVIPVGLALIVFMIKKYEDEQRRVNKLWNIKHEHLSDQVANVITYKLNPDEDLFVDVQENFSRRAHDAQQELNKKWRLTEMLNPAIISRFMVMALGVWLVETGSITLGTLFMFMGLLSEILVPLSMLEDILPQYSRRARYIDRFLNLLGEGDAIVEPLHPQKISHVRGNVEFRDVSFFYDGGEGAFGIKNISFTIEPGEHVAFVGHSGAGKSTIMALVTRLVDPTSGKILLDGADIREYGQEDYRRIIGTVLQEHSLYNETIADNIAYGKPRAMREEIIAAAKKAAADEFISRMPKGYDTLIGERGVRLSGGEKQRLAIARAILKDPKIVVLDEPTSALDSITEAKVQEGLNVLIKGRTAITIAHRLSTVRKADRIFVVRGGSIMAMGNHSELLKTCDEYRQMVELQTGGFIQDETAD